VIIQLNLCICVDADSVWKFHQSPEVEGGC
jgi:hypothetical protein